MDAKEKINKQLDDAIIRLSLKQVRFNKIKQLILLNEKLYNIKNY